MLNQPTACHLLPTAQASAQLHCQLSADQHTKVCDINPMKFTTRMLRLNQNGDSEQK